MKKSLQSQLTLMLLLFISVVASAQTVFRGTIIDQETNLPIVNARVGVVNQGVGVFTNEKGNFTYRKYHEVLENESLLKVDAVGYKTLTNDVSVIRQMINNRGIIYLTEQSNTIDNHDVSKKIAVFWDASKRAKSRDIESEKAFLMEYLSGASFSEISLTIFNETVVFEKLFHYKNAAITQIPAILDTIEYKGFSDFGNIKYQEVDEVLLIAQHKPMVGKPQINQEIPFHVVNYFAKAAAFSYFRNVTEFTYGTYYNLTESSVQAAVSEDENPATISGVVTSSNKEVNYAMVVKEGSIDEYFTNKEGLFNIPAAAGDTITIYCLGHYPKKVMVTDQGFYNVTLAAKAEILDEVLLKGNRMSIPEYAYDEKTQTDKIGTKTVPVRTIYKEDWKLHYTDIGELIEGHYGITSHRNRFGDIVTYIKGKLAGFIVDGVDTNPNQISTENIERITVTDHFEPYIIITTIFHPDVIDQRLRSYGLDPLRNNNYTENVQRIKNRTGTYFKENMITGTVFSNGTPLQNANIFKKGTLKEYITNNDGTFSMPAANGDILLVNHLGMYPKNVLVTEENEYKITLITKAVILDAVSVEAEKEEQEKEEIQTAMGMKDRRSVGYQVEDGLSKFVNPTDSDFFMVAMKLPNVMVDLETRTIFSTRSLGAIEKSPMLIVVDDIPTTQEILRIIDPQIITDITILASVASTTKYGSQGFGGVLLITTKNNSSYSAEIITKDIRVKNNDYKEEVATLNFDAIENDYINEFTQEKSTKIKFETYNKLKSEYIDKVDFYVDMTLYFQNIDAGVAATIRSDFAQIAGDNIKALRVLAYLNEYAGEYLNAQKIYERVLELAPSKPQSYRDVASVYQETGEYNKALELYINMLGDQIKGVDFSKLEVPVGNELKRLVSLHKHKIDFSRLPNDWLGVNFNIDVRLTLDWSDPDAPFEFQFVDPKKKFYTWQSANENQDDTPSNISEEFIVDDADSGKWLVNIRYTGQENDIHIPPYLKYTIYKNYGTPQEEKKLKLVRLDTQLDKVTLDSFVY